MNLNTLLGKLRINPRLVESIVLTKNFLLNDFEEILAESIQSQYNFSLSDYQILKQLISSFVFVDRQSNSIDGQYYAFFEDLSHIIAEANNQVFYKISIDFGNMYNLSLAMHRYDKTDKFLIEYIRYVLDILENKLGRVENKGLLLIRDGIDEFSFFVITNDIDGIVKSLDVSIFNINNFAINTHLSHLKHSKSKKKGGVYLKVQIEQCDRIKSRQIEFNWDKYWIETSCKNIDPNIIDLKNLAILDKFNKDEGSRIIRDNCISEDVGSMNYLYPDLIRKSIFLDQNVHKISDQKSMLMIYKTLNSEESPFEIVKNNVEYTRDLELYSILSGQDSFKNLHLVSYRWVNWSGISEAFGEESLAIFSHLIHKNIIEGIYQFNREVYSRCRFYNDYGVLRVIVVPSHTLGELLLSKSDEMIAEITNYINKIPVKYVFPTKSNLLIGEISDPRNKENYGVRIISDIIKIEPNTQISSKIIGGKLNFYSIYD